MARDPEFFRGLSPLAMLSVLIADEAADRHTKARAIGARCVRCADTGMEGGRFCGCEAGGKLGLQSSGAR
jgi:hypothetical protein